MGRSSEARDHKNSKKVKCDGRTDGRMDGQTDGWTDGPMDVRMDGPTDGPTKQGVESRSTRLKMKLSQGCGNVGSTSGGTGLILEGDI